MPRGRAAWAVVLVVAGVLEIYGIKNPGNDDTLSEFTRWAFHSDTRAGQAVFLVVWGAFSAWFAWHILNTPWKRRK